MSDAYRASSLHVLHNSKSLHHAILVLVVLGFAHPAEARSDCDMMLETWGKALVCDVICNYGPEFQQFRDEFAVVIRDACNVNSYPTGIVQRVGPGLKAELDSSIAQYGGTNGFQLFCERWKSFFKGLESIMRSTGQ